MQVLVKNPNASPITAPGLTPSFWSEEVLFMGPMFSMTSLMELSDPLGLSPFLVIDAKIAFLLSLMNKGQSLYARKIGALGVVAAHIISGAGLTHHEEHKKVERYSSEYLKHSIPAAVAPYDQVVVFGETSVDPELWKQLKTGGTYIFGSTSVPMFVNPPGTFDALGKLWPEGLATEFGWRFNDDQWGLCDLEVYKLKKLS